MPASSPIDVVVDDRLAFGLGDTDCLGIGDLG
jgi:hypothetical protein